MVLATIGTFSGGLVLDLAKSVAGSAIEQRLSGDAVKEAIQQAVSAADEEVPELFSAFERQGLKGTDRFVNNAFREMAIAQLQKPLQNEGKPDDTLLTQVFLKEAKNHSQLKDVEESDVAGWMRAFADAYFQTTTNFLKFQVVQKQYYSQLRSKTGKVVFSGMAVDGTVVDEPGELARIFVMPDVQRQSEKGYELVQIPALEIAEDAQKRVLWEQQQQRLLRKEHGSRQTPVSAVELLTSNDKNRIVILGAPGAGKTTLVNYWVVEATALFGAEHCFPMLIRIRDLVREPDLSVLEFLIKFAKADLEVEEIPTDFFQHWLKRGKALILLDGLDEVADDAQRHKVVEKIETFLCAYKACPAIITSRPAGYRDDYFSRKQYPHYELLPFDDDKIETFINHWYDSRVDMQTERERRKESLREALGKKPRIKQLARNPLLLTMIALIHRYRTLPRQRHELYNCAVETLISTWDEYKELTTNSELKYLNLPDIRRLMERLAYWIHTQGSVDDAENGTQIERGAMVRHLAKSVKEIKASKKLQLYEAEAEAETLLDKIVKDRAGLLAKQGENRYAFVHKTFQEYLCSQEILYLQEDQDPDDDDDYTPYTKNHIKQYLHDPHWREVLLLLVAQQTPSPAKASLKTILKAGSEYEQWLHRDVLFAGSCLAENAEVSDQGVIDEILIELVSLEASSQMGVSSKLRTEVFRVITSLQDTPFASAAMQRLAAYQSPIEQQRLMDYQSKLDPDEALQRLLRLVKNDDWKVRSRVAASLGQLRQSSDAVVDVLLGLVKDDDSVVRYRAAASLGQLGRSSDAVVDALVGLVKDDNSGVRSRVAASLGQLGRSSDAVVDVLVSLVKDNNLGVRSRAAVSLVQLGQSSDAVVDALVGLIKDDDLDVRSRAADSLVQLGQSSDAVVNTLVGLVKDDNSDIRYRAAASLVQLRQSSDAVVDALVGLFKDNNSDIRYRAAASLVQLGQSSDAVVDALVGLFKNNDLDIRYRAAASLVQLGQSSDAVVDALVGLVKDDDSDVRSRAAASLVQLRQSSDAVVDALVGLVKDDDLDVRSRAANSLVQLGQSSDTVVDVLVGLIKDDDLDIRSRAADSLVQLGQSSDAVVDALVGLIKDDDSDVRSRAAASLGQLRQSSDAVVDALVGLVKDDDLDVRSRAANSLVQLGQSLDVVVEALLELLKDNTFGIFGIVSDRATQSLITLAKKSDTVEPALVQWIEQHQHEAYVGNAIDALWEITS